MKKAKLQIMACIICWSSLNALTGQSLTADYPCQITHLGFVTNYSIGNNFYHENPFEQYPLLYWRPGMRTSPIVVQPFLKPLKNYDFQLYNKSLKVESDATLLPMLIEVSERKLSQYPSVNNPGIANSSSADTILPVSSTNIPEVKSAENIESSGKFEYYVPKSDRVSSSQSEINPKKIKSNRGEKVPLYQTKGWHVLNTVWFISNIIGRIALDANSPSYNHSQKSKTGEKSKSGSSNVSRRRNSNYSNSNQRK
jgi:hypothetical protein